jgi:hypothetical protein
MNLVKEAISRQKVANADATAKLRKFTSTGRQTVVTQGDSKRVCTFVQTVTPA